MTRVERESAPAGSMSESLQKSKASAEMLLAIATIGGVGFVLGIIMLAAATNANQGVAGHDGLATTGGLMLSVCFTACVISLITLYEKKKANDDDFSNKLNDAMKKAASKMIHGGLAFIITLVGITLAGSCGGMHESAGLGLGVTLSILGAGTMAYQLYRARKHQQEDEAIQKVSANNTDRLDDQDF